MSADVRAYEHGAATKLIRDALKPLRGGGGGGGDAAASYVAVGDVIETDDSDVYLK
jgi:hypothetical protein